MQSAKFALDTDKPMNYKQASDMELWHCCQKDDKKAYSELVARYIPRLGNLTQSIVKDTFLTEELVMDLLLNLWNRRYALDIKESVSAYLFQAFRYMAIRQLRKSFPRTVELSEISENAQPAGMDADYHFLCREAEQDLENKLIRVSPQSRRVFELSRNENLTYREIALRMNLSVKTVESYMVSVLAQLRKQYREQTEY